MQGGDTPNVNSHMQLESQWFAVDFAKVGGPSGRELAPGTPARIEDFYGWGAEVRAPVDGVVVDAEDGLPDNQFGTHDPVHPLGNHVELRSGDDYFYLAHFQRGSLRVKVGDRVLAGSVLGRCGNSGNSDFPHIHLHVTRSPRFGEGRGENVTYTNITVELSGKHFEHVDWPMIRGLFIEPSAASRP